MYHHQKSGHAFVWVATSEEDRIIREERKKIPAEVKFFRWDIVSGLQGFVNPNGDPNQWIWQTLDEDMRMPTEMLKGLINLPGANEECDGSIIFMHDFHEFFKDVEVQRCTLNMKDHLKSTGKMVVFLSHGVDIPPAMRDAIKVLNFKLPDEDELHGLLSRFSIDYPHEFPKDTQAIVDAMKGLTLEGAENALALSYAEKGTVDMRIVLEAKAANLKTTGYLTYMPYQETFDDLYGLEKIKEYAPACVESGEGEGILLYGFPGTGKSHMSKALANHCNLPCLSMDMAALRGGIVGETEANTRDCFNRIDAFGKSIVFIDEMGGSFSGMDTAGKSDGGVNNRVGKHFLKYWEDREPGTCYFIGTTNELEPFLEFSSGAMLSRFDAVFFLDMPTQAECQGIAKIWSEKMDVDIPKNFNFEGWTGRDIKKLAKTMKMMKTCADKAKDFIVPTAQRLGAGMADIRKKAATVCRPASDIATVTPGIRKIKMGR